MKTNARGKSSSGSREGDIIQAKKKFKDIKERNDGKGKKVTKAEKVEREEAFKDVKHAMFDKTSAAYLAGKKDMAALLSLFSPHLCTHLVLVWGLGRKTVNSNADIYNYCEGFNARLRREYKRLKLDQKKDGGLFQCPI